MEKDRSIAQRNDWTKMKTLFATEMITTAGSFGTIQTPGQLQDDPVHAVRLVTCQEKRATHELAIGSD